MEVEREARNGALIILLAAGLFPQFFGGVGRGGVRGKEMPWARGAQPGVKAEASESCLVYLILLPQAVVLSRYKNTVKLYLLQPRHILNRSALIIDLLSAGDSRSC